ncbi:AAA family ATPase [Desulfobacula sp.]|uniref:AAA family ATPase n=1 Tax=Desulfobacula sp. TaxID=2593537 RepID=UPI002617A74B|nr:AAA family ATPase [Desulfobacula sp.]
MWFGEKHREALATLKYGILDNKGFLLLTGDVGTGKTTLINTLLQSLSDNVICTSVPDPGLEKLDFFNYIAAAFGIDQEFKTKGAFLSRFRQFLIQADEDNKKVLLIIDESQLLTQEMLEEIRLLSNIEKTDAKLINIFFVGQNEFNEILNKEKNRAVRQRLTLNYNIDPLTPDETGDYIKHRLSIAGATDPIFDEAAIQEVFMYSGGFPRRINILCDHSLLSGYVKEQKIITHAIVKECAKELRIPAHIRNRDINGFTDYPERPVPFVTPQAYPSQPVQPEKREPRKKKTGLVFFLTGIMGVLLVFMGWFYLFPNAYSDSMAGIQKNVTALKYKFLQFIPESTSSFLEHKAESKERREEKMTAMVKKEDPFTGKSDDQTQSALHEDPAIDASMMIIGKIHPLQQDAATQNELSHMNQPQAGVKSKAIHSGKEPENQPQTKKIKTGLHSGKKAPQEPSDDLPGNAVIHEILPLPDEKIIVRFKYNANEFTEEGHKNLAEFADILVTHPGTKILISGYTDSEGYQTYNQKLSEFRASIIRSFFLGRGIKGEQIQIQGLGSQNPIESNDTAWGRKMNRRVEIEIIK